MAGEKIKLMEEAISEILIADTRLGIKKCFPTQELQAREIIHPTPLLSVFFLWPEKGTMYKCARCDVGLCVVPCLAEYHTKVNL
jgi:hypothetical protein